MDTSESRPLEIEAGMTAIEDLEAVESMVLQGWPCSSSMEVVCSLELNPSLDDSTRCSATMYRMAHAGEQMASSTVRTTSVVEDTISSEQTLF